MKTLLLLALPLTTLLLASCSTNPGDAAVDAATSDMDPAQSALVRKTTGYGTGPAEQMKNDTTDKLENITN